MDSVTRIRITWALKRKGIPVREIAEEVERDRSTVYRWLKGIGRYGIEGYIRRYRAAKKGRRIRKTHPYLEQRVLSIRREYRNCCGQKIVYLLKQEGVELSLSTVYRILNRHLSTLRKHCATCCAFWRCVIIGEACGILGAADNRALTRRRNNRGVCASK